MGAMRRLTSRFDLLLALAMLAVVASILLAGCNYPPAAGTPPFIGGDSLTVQTAITEGALPQGWDVVSSLGWQAENVQPGLTDRVTDPVRSPRVVVLALGENDGADGLGAVDRQQLTQLAETPGPGACIRWVLPWYTGTDQVKLQGIADYRTWVTTWAAAHGQQVFDWQRVALASPDDVDADGTHLTPAGRMDYGQLLQQAVASCG